MPLNCEMFVLLTFDLLFSRHTDTNLLPLVVSYSFLALADASVGNRL